MFKTFYYSDLIDSGSISIDINNILDISIGRERASIFSGYLFSLRYKNNLCKHIKFSEVKNAEKLKDDIISKMQVII